MTSGGGWGIKGSFNGALVVSVVLHLAVLATAGSMAWHADAGDGSPAVIWVSTAGDGRQQAAAPGPQAPAAAGTVPASVAPKAASPSTVPPVRAPEQVQQAAAVQTPADAAEDTAPEAAAREDPGVEAAEGPATPNSGQGATQPFTGAGPRRVAMAGGAGLAGLLSEAAAPVYRDAVPLSLPDPVYPRLSRRQGEEGRVVLEVRVGVNGRALEVVVAQPSAYPRLDRAAMKAAGRASFRAASADGVPVESVLRVAYRFVLSGPEAQ